MSKRKVLIVEDDHAIAELERDFLEVHGYEVTLRADGRQALEEALKQEYDLIILDVMLPGMDGFELLRRIRETKFIPVLMVSARKEDIDKIRGLGLGADDYVTKPFSPTELVARVKAHLERYDRLTGVAAGTGLSHARKSRELNIRELTIQVDARRVTLRGTDVTMTAKEFDLLLFLAENPDRVYSKEALLDRVWGIENYGDTATVTVHVGKIRDKIQKDPSQHQFIETVWGAGYRFKV
ncbi:response regulator transcription factor [Cohnella thailandensis]|uniref:Response regulator transcription factor n=1 Tax=Cohnella thailandensis TaxID=557557 RepID=A0A841SR61_9BACL|nr:response regulator transcription factor [Cohnella thailandensis]MBB6633096.1 response regulator transcription factor [Cohnella thailandensis]MBP1975209.1 DNA-binding response OmpR family regulator [Cohnella thailandensis]